MFKLIGLVGCLAISEAKIRIDPPDQIFERPQPIIMRAFIELFDFSLTGAPPILVFLFG